MALIVEDGTGKATAESYVSAADTLTYATAHGLIFADSASGEQALRRATAWIDAHYRARFPGLRRNLRAQALEWPRVGVADMYGFPVAFDSVPMEVVTATNEAAIRELASPGSLMPDLDRGGDVRRLKAGSVEIEYGAGASATTLFPLIDGILALLIGQQQLYYAAAGRG